MKLARWGAVFAVLALAGCAPTDVEVPTRDLIPDSVEGVAGPDADLIYLKLDSFQILDAYVVSNATCPLITFQPKLASSSLDAIRRAFASRYRIVDQPSQAKATVIVAMREVDGRMTCRRGFPYVCNGSLTLEYLQEVEPGGIRFADGTQFASTTARPGTEHVFCSGMRIEFEKHFKSAFENLVINALEKTEAALRD